MVQADPTLLEAATVGVVRALALHLLTQGQQGAAPDWFAQLQQSRLLLCPPWELDEAHPDRPPATRAEWVRRATLVVMAEQEARTYAAQRQRASAGLYVPQ